MRGARGASEEHTRTRIDGHLSTLPAAGPRHGWAWAALPAAARRIEVRGDDDLARTLTAAGYEVVERDADVIAVVGPAPAQTADRGRLAVALAALDPRPALAARRLAHSLDGLTVRRLDTGNPARRHSLEWDRGPRPGRRAILLGTASDAGPTALEAAVAAASAAVGAAVTPGPARVLASGSVMVEADVEARGRHLLRVAGGAAADLLWHASRVQRYLTATGPPAVAGRLVPPLAEGRDGPRLWTLEPFFEGRPATRIEEATEFLSALFGVAPALDLPPPPGPGEDAGTLLPHVGDPDLLRRAAERLEADLAEVPRGWSHGDFWTANLLEHDGRLASVLDWDSAAPAYLPLLDLLHLVSHADPAMRALSLGERCSGHLWPLARAGGDDRLRSHCAAVGASADARTLEALAVAYWLARAARDVRTFADRAQRPRWMDANVHRPLAALGSAGW